MTRPKAASIGGPGLLPRTPPVSRAARFPQPGAPRRGDLDHACLLPPSTGYRLQAQASWGSGVQQYPAPEGALHGTKKDPPLVAAILAPVSRQRQRVAGRQTISGPGSEYGEAYLPSSSEPISQLCTDHE